MNLPFCVSITGPDDQVDPQELVRLSARYPFVEWALLYFAEKEGAPRTPTADWRQRFLATRREHGLPCALHLCGAEVFHALLDGRARSEFFAELAEYDRIQVNIGDRFTSEQQRKVYEVLANQGARLILQRHPGTAEAVDRFIKERPLGYATGEVAVLLDASRGRGQLPSQWPLPVTSYGVTGQCGYAGGLGPDNVEQVCLAISALVAGSTSPDTRFWLDMETGVRTNNQFDLAKVEAVLAQLGGGLVRQVKGKKQQAPVINKAKFASGFKARARTQPADTPFGPELHAACLDLLRSHPEAEAKFGAGVSHFSWTVLASNPGELRMVVHRVDGSSDTWSPRTCLEAHLARDKSQPLWRDGQRAAKDALFNATSSLRNAFYHAALQSDDGLPEQVVAYRPETPFQVLVRRFLEQEQLTYRQVKTVTVGPHHILVDPELTTRWRAFHTRHARLCLAHRDCVSWNHNVHADLYRVPCGEGQQQENTHGT